MRNSKGQLWNSTQKWKFKSPQIYEFVCVCEMPPVMYTYTKLVIINPLMSENINQRSLSSSYGVNSSPSGPNGCHRVISSPSEQNGCHRVISSPSGQNDCHKIISSPSGQNGCHRVISSPCEKMAAISRMTFSNTFSTMKMYEFWLKFHCYSKLVQIMAWCRPGDKPLFEPIMVRLQTHICVIHPQRVDEIFVTCS